MTTCRDEAGNGPALWVALAWVACTAAIGMLSCCGGHAPAPRPPALELERRACLAEPPPEPHGLTPAGPEQGCPETWAMCLERDGALALIDYLATLRRYAADAWDRCGPETKETPK